jgi:drug/metabolite transporter (DMT)-like permease
VAAVALLALAAGGVGRHERPVRRPGDWWRLAALGVVGNGLFQLCLVHGVHRTSPAHAALLVALSPIFAALLAALWLGERLSPRRILGIVVAFAGVALIVSRGGDPAGGPTWLGDLLSLGAGLAWAFYSVAGKPLLARRPAFEVTTWAMAFGALPLLPLGLPGLAAVPWRDLSPGAWLLLAYLSVGTLAVANLIWYWALARAATARVVAFSYLNPVVAAVIAVVLRQEAPTVALALGALAVLTGVTLAGGAGGQTSKP